MKLTRAVVPMCPECGAECKQTNASIRDYAMYKCGCGWNFINPDRGYHAVDIAGVVAEMGTIATAGMDAGSLRMVIARWRDELEGSHE